MTGKGWGMLAAVIVSPLPGIIFEGMNMYGKGERFENANAYERIAADVGLFAVTLLGVIGIILRDCYLERQQAKIYGEVDNRSFWSSCWNTRGDSSVNALNTGPVYDAL